MTKFQFVAVVIASAAIYSALLFLSATQENETNDEPAHIIAGYSYWTKGDFRLNPEHPPFSKLLCTLPLLILKPTFPDDPEAWADADQFRLGKKLLYGSGDGGERILLACRSMSILFTAVFAVCFAIWARQRFSIAVTLLLFFLFLFDPNIAAHARYVTSDVFVMAFCFFAIVCWYAWLRDRRRIDLWLTGAAVALALGSKFSALLIPPMLFLMWIVNRLLAEPRESNAPVAQAGLRHKVLPLLIVPAVIIFTLYAGDTRSVSEDPLVSARYVARQQAPSSWQRVDIPAYYWFRGIQLLARHQIGGHGTPAYLLGELSDRGFVGYFPVAILVKTPTGTLLLLAVALLSLRSSMWKNRRGLTLTLAALTPIAVYLPVAMVSSIDIGVRHILLLYPFLYVLLGVFTERAASGRIARIAVWCALALNVVEFVSVYPSQIAFFNSIAGGPNAGPRYLIDSNIDWGQGLIHLKRFLVSQPSSCLSLEYFGRADIKYYFPDARLVPESAEAAKKQACLIAVSVQWLYGDSEKRLAYLQDQEPIARPGFAIYVYDPSLF